MIDWLWLVLALGAAAAVRSVFMAASAGNAVDHYYWLLAARAYREGGAWPVRIRGKYLLEDERQAYPPLFGWLLARLPERWLASRHAPWLAQAVDAFVLALIVGHAVAGGASLRGLAAIIAVFGTAPVLVAYNTQIASRGLGNLFLVVALLSAAAAAELPPFDLVGLAWFVVASAAATAIVLTHKMTLQLLLALWLPWAVALGDWRMLLVPPLAIGAAALVTGREFARLQWRAHAEIVAFWHRHRDLVGAHLFHHSPVYGDPARVAEAAFHRPGLRGWIAHASLAFGYAPLAWLAPLMLLAAPAPPGWVILWTLGTGVVALLTLYVPPLRRFGGGHLYLFNAVAPAALWWGDVLRDPEPVTLGLFALGMAATFASLALGLRRRRTVGKGRDEGFEAALAHLGRLPPGRVAVFPVTAADAVACRTPHAVLWGAHGLGFPLLEPLFPVLRVPLRELLARHRCDLVLIDTRYWPAADDVIRRELAPSGLHAFGAWRLAVLAPAAGGEALRPAAVQA